METISQLNSILYIFKICLINSHIGMKIHDNFILILNYLICNTVKPVKMESVEIKKFLS